MILALHAAGPVTVLGLYASPENPMPTAELSWESGRHLATELLGYIQDLLDSQNAQFGDIEGIIIFSGPGSFTSLRIGHSVANALADSLDIPISGATGSDWITTALSALSGTPNSRPALPHYGGDANITSPARPIRPTKT